MRNIKSSLCFVLIFGLMFSNGVVKADAAKAAIGKAEAARLEAKERGFEWSTTSLLISKAIEADKNGDKTSAVQLAEKALREAENAIKQAEYAAKNWKKFAL